MKKTALTQLIEQLEEQKSKVPVETYQKGLDYAIQAAKLKLETEREQIEEAVEYGFFDALKPISNQDKTFQQYYKDTYE